MEKDLDSIPQKPGNRKQKIERAAKKKKQKNDYKEGDDKSLSVDIEAENSSNNLEDIQRQLDREMQLEIDKVSNSDELDMDERSAKIELINLGYKKRLLEEQKRIEIERVLKSPIINEDTKDSLIKSTEEGYEKKVAELINTAEEVHGVDKENNSAESVQEEAVAKGMEGSGEEDKLEQNKLSTELAKGLDEEFNTIDANGVDRYLSRKASKIVLNRTDSYDKLNAKTEDEGNKKFLEETKQILKDLAVHGKLEKNKETGEFNVINKTDLDCTAALCLLDMAGVDTKKVEYVAPGEIKGGKINIDTGNKEGLHILEDGTVIIDHHGEESQNNTSATEKVFEMLTSLGALKNYNSLRNLVSFVNKVDNLNYPESYFKNYFTNSWETLYGLSKMLDRHELRRFFEYRKAGKPLDPGEPMDDEVIKKIGLIRTIKDKKTDKERVVNKPASHKEWVLKAKEELDLMEKEGFIIESDRYGKICLNINGRMKCGTDAAKAFGCDTYLAWNNNSNNFFISSLNRKKLEDDFGDGLNVRGTMWINPLDKERKITLAEILNKMTDGKFEPSEDVKKILEEKEIPGTENEEKEDETVESPENTNEAPENTEEVLTDLNHEEIGHPAPETINDDMPVIDEFEIKDTIELSEEEKVLSSEELKKVLSLERREKMSENREALRKKFGSFILRHQGEEFGKVMLHRILDLDDKFAQINRKFKKMEESDEMDENILNEINKLDGEIINLVSSNWEDELLKFKESSEGAEFKFTEKEKNIVEKSKEIANRFVEGARSKFPWEKFPQERVDFTLETQAVFFLMEEFRKRKFFAGNEESVAEFIIKNRK